MSQTPTVGSTVLYKLSEADVQAIETRRLFLARTVGQDSPRFFGNPARVGQEYPAVVVAVFTPSEMGTSNLQVVLDGYDTYWAGSRYNADSEYVRQQQERTVEPSVQAVFPDGEGCWRWPTIVSGNQTLVPRGHGADGTAEIDTELQKQQRAAGS